MCMQDACAGCSKPTWAGCGQHIEHALKGVAVDARCPGWKTGEHCTAEKGGAQSMACPACGERLQASTAEYLEEMLELHYEMDGNTCHGARKPTPPPPRSGGGGIDFTHEELMK